MDKDVSFSPLIVKYERRLAKDPRSKAFAPLAESYRKIGLIDKAVELIQSGIRYNPDYILGYLGLARCYFDLGQYNLAHSTLRPLVSSSRENIHIQELFAELCEKIGSQEEALDTYKYLLFFNPKDKRLIDKVNFLESKINEVLTPLMEEGEDLIHFDLEQLNPNPINDDHKINDWVQVDLGGRDEDQGDLENWEINREDEQGGKKEVEDSKKPDNVKLSVVENDSSPVITHTLIDLYIKQGHLDKAEEILEKILELDPNDNRTQEKLLEVKSLEREGDVVTFPEKEEEKGRQDLMNLVDKKISDGPTDHEHAEIVKETLYSFQMAIRKKAEAFKTQ